MDGIRVICVTRDEDIEIVRQRNQTSVEHPMSCARERQTVRYDIGSIAFHGPYMRSIDFGPPSSIDELQSSDGAPFTVGLDDQPSE